MKKHPSSLKFLLGISVAAVMTACGVDGEQSMAPLAQQSDIKPEAQRSEGEESVGFVASSGTTQTDGSLWSTFFNTKSPEHWDYTKYDPFGRVPDSPWLYEPKNHTAALGSFKRSYFTESKQTCSGALVHQRSGSKYNIYYLTAHHCLYDVNPLGERQNGRSSQMELSSFDYSQDIRGGYFEFNNSFRVSGMSGTNIKTKSWRLSGNKETLAIPHVEIYENSDVIRIPYKLDADSAGNSLPLCGSVSAPADKTFGSSNTDVRLLVGYNSNLTSKRLEIERMNGKHNLQGKITGEYRAATSFADIRDYVFKSMMFGSAVTYYGYNMYFNGGAEGSDSGAPVFYGQQSPSANTLGKSGGSFVSGADKLAEHWKIESIDCVSGVVSRILSQPKLRVSDSAIGGLWRQLVTQLTDVGQETVTIIQEVKDSGRWSQL
ncbi:MAG: hypothetical protein EBR09_02475 [Proteobacteria bacterium]|nr:hypothetical protein [Pseudomonadota bacterium]